MRNDEGYSDKSVLYHLLLEHDRWLRQYVDRRLPADVRNTLSLEEILQEIWILVFRDIPGFHPDDPDAVDHRLKLIAMRTVRRSVRATRAINRREVFRFLRASAAARRCAQHPLPGRDLTGDLDLGVPGYSGIPPGRPGCC